MGTLTPVRPFAILASTPNENKQPTGDERMDALRMNLELMGYRIEDSRREFREEIAASREEFRERNDLLMKAISDLLVATGAIATRVERIERKIA
ncbi:MAG: hypothetical protein EBY17_00320 [Acidobacteriia bacterium]|nr:hypothetical protein [Terriglobia bacterium]